MGPCLCGDPYCSSCGNPALAAQEEAENWAMETLSKAKLSPDEYRMAVSVGLAAVHHARRLMDIARDDVAANNAEYIAYLEQKAEGLR